VDHEDGAASGQAWRSWFTVPPYPGWLLLGVLLVSFAVTVALLAGPRLRPAPSTQVAVAPLAATPPVVAPSEPAEASQEAPVVMIRPMPERLKPPVAPANQPAPSLGHDPSLQPGVVPPSPQTQPSGTAPAEPGIPPFLAEPGVQAAPVEIPRVETPRVEAPQPTIPPAPAVESARPEPPRVEAPRVEPPRPRPRVPPVQIPAYDTGRLTIFFDADSSTFDRNDERLPLRVQVFVDGQMRVDDDDPEKREFDLGRLREGRHEVVVVPYVGRAKPEPRRFRVEVEADRNNRFKAVLRREEGSSLVAKFRPAD
jgi:hypothetical protein